MIYYRNDSCDAVRYAERDIDDVGRLLLIGGGHSTTRGLGGPEAKLGGSQLRDCAGR